MVAVVGVVAICVPTPPLLPCRASTSTFARPLDSVRTDMSTGRLEATMASLLAEKSVLMRRLNAVEKELRDDRKKNEPKKGPRRH